MRICSELQARGLLCEAGKHPQVVRQDGYVGMDILPFLIAFFCWGGATSFKDFGKTCLGFGPALAAVCGRKKWPSPSSVRNPRRLTQTDLSSWITTDQYKLQLLLAPPQPTPVDFRNCTPQAPHRLRLAPVRLDFVGALARV